MLKVKRKGAKCTNMIPEKRNKKTADTTALEALSVMQTFAESYIITDNTYLNFSNNEPLFHKNEKAVKTAQLEESKVLTDDNQDTWSKYINFSLKANIIGGCI